MSAADMHKLATDRWKTPRAAKRALERHRETDGNFEIRVSDDEYRPTEKAKYRPQNGRAGVWSSACYRVQRDVNDVISAIQEKLAGQFGEFFKVKFDR